jgi:hypothetical protein
MKDFLSTSKRKKTSHQQLTSPVRCELDLTYLPIPAIPAFLLLALALLTAKAEMHSVENIGNVATTNNGRPSYGC